MGEMKYDFYAFRNYNKKGKRLEMWTLRRGKFTTGRGTKFTTKELDDMEKNYKIKRVSRRG